ncbi:MAG: AAA family ATPase [Nocardioidaceae bacterium]
MVAPGVLRPFPFETPIAPDALIDRRTELLRLSQAAAERTHVRLAGPRRFGKTSLLLAHAAGLRGAGWRTVHVDMYGVTSLAEVCVRIASSYSRLRDNRLRGHLDSLGARLGLSLTAAGPGISLGPRSNVPSPEATQTAAAELLDLPLNLFERDGIPTLVVFDEFQDLLTAGPSLDGLLRSHVQYHADAAVYVYAGSQPSLMRKLFSDRERPLYGQAEPLELGPLPLDEVLVELAERFAELDEDPVGALSPLVATAAGHPQRTMLLAHLLHRELSARTLAGTTLPEGGSVEGIALADAVVRRALSMTNEAHQAVWDVMSSGKKAVLAALADGDSPTGTTTARRLGSSRATLQSALRELGREGQHVTREGDTGPWRYVDPLLALWVRSRGRTYA